MSPCKLTLSESSDTSILKGIVTALDLELTSTPPTGQQQRVIDDALRLLATWAIRAALNAPQAPISADSEASSALTGGRGEVMNGDSN